MKDRLKMWLILWGIIFLGLAIVILPMRIFSDIYLKMIGFAIIILIIFVGSYFILGNKEGRLIK